METLFEACDDCADFFMFGLLRTTIKAGQRVVGGSQTASNVTNSKDVWPCMLESKL